MSDFEVDALIAGLEIKACRGFDDIDTTSIEYIAAQKIRELKAQLKQSEERAEELEKRSSLLQKTLKMLHEDVCYQLSDNPMYIQPDRPSAKTFKVVEGVLNK